MRHWTFSIDREGLGHLVLDHADARVNTLGSEVLAELDQALAEIEQASPKGIIITSGKKRGFIAGADIAEFNEFNDEAQLRESLKRAHAVFDRLESLPMPTVAAINGFCLGGGLELALACTYRVATRESTLGFPEVRLGIFPGFGGTGRSVQRSGALAAMTAMLTGKNHKATAARRIGWLERVVDTPDRLFWAARKLILGRKRAIKRPLAHRLMHLKPIRGYLAKKMRQQTQAKANPNHYPAPFALIDLFEACGGTHQSMRAGEIERFPAMMLSRTSESLRRVFLASEALKKVETPFKGRRLHVIGAGVMGGDIAAWAAFSGFDVTLQDLTQDAIEPALKRAESVFKKRLRKQPAIDNARSRLRADVNGEGIAQADIIIEAVVEKLEVKQPLFQRLEEQAKPEALLATNTSSLPLEDIAKGMRDPSRLVGVHFFNPVAKLPLVEIIQGAETSSKALEQARGFVVAIRKYPLLVKSAPGFLVNRVLAPYMFGALDRLEQGAKAEDLDAAAVAFGMPMGPIELMDSVGLDVCLAVAQELGLDNEKDNSLKQLIDQGKLGRKSNQGFYAWDKGKAQRTLPSGDAELGALLLKPLVDTCEACLAKGIVQDAESLDIGVIFGTGFAPFLGGPLRARALGVV